VPNHSNGSGKHRYAGKYNLTITPAILFAGRKYDVSKWSKPPFGTTVLCYVQSENSDPRAELGIVLSYFDSSSNNSYNVWSVNSQRIVVRRNCKVLKATPSDLKLKAKDPILPSHIPDFIESPYYSHLPEPGEETYREEGAIYAATNRNESITTSIARGNDDGLSQHPVESRISDALDDEIVGVTESPVMQSDVIIRENEAVNEGHIAPTEMRGQENKAVNEGHIAPTEMRSQENEAVNEGHIAPTEMRGQENEAVNEGHETEHSARSRSGRVLKRRLYEGFDTFLAETEKGSTDILMGMLGMKDTSVKEALAGARSEEARRAILDEIGNMINYSVGYYIKYDQIPLNLRRNILRSFMFVKEKYHPDG